jgi:hypothetical protein
MKNHRNGLLLANIPLCIPPAAVSRCALAAGTHKARNDYVRMERRALLLKQPDWIFPDELDRVLCSQNQKPNWLCEMCREATSRFGDGEEWYRAAFYQSGELKGAVKDEEPCRKERAGP